MCVLERGGEGDLDESVSHILKEREGRMCALYCNVCVLEGGRGRLEESFSHVVLKRRGGGVSVRLPILIF